jgi:hypothetical protein
MVEFLKNLFIKKAKNKSDLLKSIDFGSETAENEDNLSDYFIETNIWDLILHKKYDGLILGSKGSGKSSLYKMLINKSEILKKKSILLVCSDQVSGTPAFNTLQNNNSNKEKENLYNEDNFKSLWKLYFIQLITDKLIDVDRIDENVQRIINILNDNKLSVQNKKTTFHEKIENAIKFISNIKEIGGQVGLTTGVKIVFHSVPNDDSKISVDHIYKKLDQFLADNSLSVIIAMDRLDASFPANSKLEKVALKSLLKVHQDLKSYSGINFIIFIRNDIWNIVTEGGFRELSHINTEDIVWDKDNLYKLLLRRLYENKVLLKTYKMNKNKLIENINLQHDLFHKLFPEQVNKGIKEAKTFNWILSRLSDATGNVMPRDLIFFINSLKKDTKNKIANGSLSNELDNQAIFTKDSFDKALKIVSDKRLNTNLYAEYPHLKDYIESFKGQKAEHSQKTLEDIWETSFEETKKISSELSEIGFLTSKNNKYVVPYLYRKSELEIKNGKQT